MNEFTIDFVSISSSTNPTSHYGFVSHDYRMGTYEITNDQWTKFKNEYGTVYGNPTYGYDEETYWTGTNLPTNRVSWYEAAQFVNWLNTSTGHQAAYKFSGTQGTSGYTLDVWDAEVAWDGLNFFRHKDAYYFLPTEHEWVKAAYWNGTNLQTWATSDDTQPLEKIDANYYFGPDAHAQSPWAVGSGIKELNGTYDMMGNVWEWMESPYYVGSYQSDSHRHIRGGGYYLSGDSFGGYCDVRILSSSARSIGASPQEESWDWGFRVASVPEPITLLLMGFGGLVLRSRRNFK